MNGEAAVRLAVVDYEAGNLRSIGRALQRAGAAVTVVQDPPAPDRFEAVVLPGVGAFGSAMRRLQAAGFPAWIQAQAASGRPVIGVCLGMQLLYERSEESPGIAGLALLAGEVRRLPPGLKVPHMGWNRLSLARPDEIFPSSLDGMFAYFVHSYVVSPKDAGEVVAAVTYGDTFPAVVRRGGIVGWQFHPEKSADGGLRLLRQLVRWISAGRGQRSTANGGG